MSYRYSFVETWLQPILVAVILIILCDFGKWREANPDAPLISWLVTQ